MQPHCSGKDLLPNERNGNLNFLGIRLRTRSFILIASFRVNPYAGSDSPMHTWTYNSKNRLNDTKSNRFDVIWNGNDIFSCFSSCNSYTPNTDILDIHFYHIQTKTTSSLKMIFDFSKKFTVYCVLMIQKHVGGPSQAPKVHFFLFLF